MWEAALWPRCSFLKPHCPVGLLPCLRFCPGKPSFPSCQLTQPLSLHLSPFFTALLCTCSKYLPSRAPILLSSLPAHSWDDPTRELISTAFLTASPSLEHVRLYLIFLWPLKHGIFSGLTVFLSPGWLLPCLLPVRWAPQLCPQSGLMPKPGSSLSTAAGPPGSPHHAGAPGTAICHQ